MLSIHYFERVRTDPLTSKPIALLSFELCLPGVWHAGSRCGSESRAEGVAGLQWPPWQVAHSAG